MASAMQSTSDQTRTGPRGWTTHAIDWLERGAVLALFGWLVLRIVGGYVDQGGIGNLLLLASEGLVVFFILIRRSTSDVSLRPGDWLLAFSATTAALLVQPGSGAALLPPSVLATLLLMGIFVQLHAKLVLARSFGCVPANRGLKFAGPYRYVRHPMYLGYLLSHVAFVLMNPTGWNLGVYVLCYALQVPRLLAEERLLREDAEYRDYMAVVRYRLIPGVF